MKKGGLVLGFLVAGCASNNTLYDWGNYQPALIEYTKSSDEAKFEESLRKSINLAEAKDRVPPGLYAELGYLLHRTERASEAAEFFRKERARFPESVTLMNRFIAEGGAE